MPTQERPVFYFDLGSPYAYLAAERINAVLPQSPIWQPVLLGGLYKQLGRKSWASGPERDKQMATVAERARARHLLPLRWPDRWPGDMLQAMRAATYAGKIGKGQAFALAAFRQAFAGGKDLGVIENVLIAAAACEISPRAILKAIASKTIKDGLRSATGEAIAAGVWGVPSIRVGDQIFWGDDHLEQAADALE